MLCNFELYTGQQQADASEGEGLTHAVVLRLTEHLANSGRIIYTDNFYTSPALTESLRERGFHLVGTVRSNRRGFPQELKADTKKLKNMQHEELCAMCETGCPCTRVERSLHCVHAINHSQGPLSRHGDTAHQGAGATCGAKHATTCRRQ